VSNTLPLTDFYLKAIMKTLIYIFCVVRYISCFIIAVYL